jgi:S1-C subfamily serine protease
MNLSDDMLPHSMPFTGRRAQRAMLGINLGSRRESDRPQGVEIISVSPGGPSATAGLKAGDVLLAIDGKSLQADAKDTARQKLFEALEDVDVGDKVALIYERAGKRMSADIIARPVADHFFIQGGMPGRMGDQPFPPQRFERFEGAFGAAEFVPMTAKLGQYFGTDKGLLVVRAPADSQLKLEEGDVLLDIDGRVPANAGHALRILGSYQTGEKLKLGVMRQKKRVSFEITLPEDLSEHGAEKSGRFLAPRLHMMPMPAARPDAAPLPPLPGPPSSGPDETA